MKNEGSNILFFLGYVILGMSLGTQYSATVGWSTIALGFIVHALINRGEYDE